MFELMFLCIPIVCRIAVTEDGQVYSCGWSADGQTGLGHFDSVSKFTRVKGDIEREKITKISCRSDFVMALNGTCSINFFKCN